MLGNHRSVLPKYIFDGSAFFTTTRLSNDDKPLILTSKVKFGFDSTLFLIQSILYRSERIRRRGDHNHNQVRERGAADGLPLHAVLQHRAEVRHGEATAGGDQEELL